jgi:hypothetical protein
MPSPFPGVDPYLEASGRWEDFHDTFITYCRDILLDAISPTYLVRIKERVASISVPDGKEKQSVPDVGISAPPGYEGGGLKTAGALTTIESVTLEHEYTEPIKETYLEILHGPERKLVTVIELLSPTNKESPGRDLYLAKRESLLAQYVHIVEVDLLLRGARLPMKKALPKGDYFVFVSRAERRFFGDVTAWNIRHPIPVIPVPLLAPDSDIMLDLGALFQLTYDRGRYRFELNYKADPPSFLRPEDREWAREIVSKMG